MDTITNEQLDAVERFAKELKYEIQVILMISAPGLGKIINDYIDTKLGLYRERWEAEVKLQEVAHEK